MFVRGMGSSSATSFPWTKVYTFPVNKHEMINPNRATCTQHEQPTRTRAGLSPGCGATHTVLYSYLARNSHANLEPTRFYVDADREHLASGAASTQTCVVPASRSAVLAPAYCTLDCMALPVLAGGVITWC